MIQIHTIYCNTETNCFHCQFNDDMNLHIKEPVKSHDVNFVFYDSVVFEPSSEVVSIFEVVFGVASLLLERLK